ncbi:MAG: FkbM family methyltransferase [Ferruginibacter sp.]
MKELIYKLLDIASMGRGLQRTINGHRLRLPTRYFKYFPETYEADNFAFLHETCKPGAVIIDIGAHIGLFSVIAAQVAGKTGKVYAFEPAPGTYALLQKTVSINHAGTVIETFQKAVGKANGKITFFVSDNRADNSNSLVNYKDDRSLHGIDVAVTSIDDFVREKNISRLDFIKIDVEGAEYDTLLGAVHTLKHVRPACIVAIHPEPIAAKGDSLEAIYDLVAGCNYRITLDNKDFSKAALLANTELIDLHIYPN